MKKQLRITFLDFDDIKNPILAAGQARATVEVGKRLAKKGHRVTVICSKYPGYKDRLENGMYYKHIGLGTRNIRLNNLVYILTVPYIVWKLQTDVIVECFTAPISTLLSPLFTNIPVVVVPSSFEADQFSKKYHLPFFLIERFGLKLYTYFLPYSTVIDQKIKSYNARAVSRIVPEGVSNEYFKIKKKKAKHILFLGRFDISQKGIDLLLKAYFLVKDEISYPLIIAGSGPDEGKIRNMITHLHLDGKVFMKGYTTGEKKYQLLSESLFVAFPSRHETFSCFALEAFASSLPLVTFDIPGLCWIKTNVAVKAKQFDIKAYAQMLKKYADEKITTQLGKKSREFAKQFTWEHVTNEYELFFKEVIQKETYEK